MMLFSLVQVWKGHQYTIITISTSVLSMHLGEIALLQATCRKLLAGTWLSSGRASSIWGSSSSAVQRHALHRHPPGSFQLDTLWLDGGYRSNERAFMSMPLKCNGHSAVAAVA
jgi:hypothetical protein